MNSPLSGRVSSGFGGSGKYKNKVVLGAAIVGVVPFILSTFAASVTVGSGALEFGQGSQQAIACDPLVYAAISEEWHSAPTDADASAGYFRVKALTVANLDLVSCRGKKLRVRLIDTQGAEIPIGFDQSSRVLQVNLPDLDVPVDANTTTNPELGLVYLTGDGQMLSGIMDAAASISTAGTSIYDGSDLTANNADVTFYLDPSKLNVNIDGQYVGRTTVETVNNPKK
jgi:hypothetical protein